MIKAVENAPKIAHCRVHSLANESLCKNTQQAQKRYIPFRIWNPFQHKRSKSQVNAPETPLIYFYNL